MVPFFFIVCCWSFFLDYIRDFKSFP